ncbi:hypothetical protein [Micromonospora cathayae]|uniref:Uncharacterized protein n=1 Tax=Micromonospora cathayae TaxID=3028804 RepID=A0ABY7ZXD3_9ACTN|nr:hypothetical protein [Micromonospora sp. HUAS 3]WDZ87692.1 hypothetical protein PVK37_15415 [Micromonospora sp. HUAS 3]
MAAVWRRYAARFGVLAVGLVVAVPGLPAPARADFATILEGLPDRLGTDRVETVTAVVSRDDAGGCLRVRWSMLLTVRGLRLDQVRMDRVESDGPFPVQVRVAGSAARLTDRRPDPGTLCPGRTVTARYRLALAGDVTGGRVTLTAEAYDEGSRLLARQTATRNVAGPSAPEPTDGPAVPDPAEADPDGADPDGADPDGADPVDPGLAADGEPADPTDVVDPTDVPGEAAGSTAGPAAGTGGRVVAEPAGSTGGFGVVQAAFLLGGLLVFLGVGLLLRMRQVLGRTADEPAFDRPFTKYESL